MPDDFELDTILEYLPASSSCREANRSSDIGTIELDVEAPVRG